MRAPELLMNVYRRALHPIGNLRKGTNIYDYDWDLCIIVDACRYDLFEEVADDYEYISTYSDMISVDSKTEAWVQKTFSDDSPAVPGDTAYVTANPFSRVVPDEDDFAHFDALWRYAWDDDIGTVPPRAVTDRAIMTWREHRPPRLLVHYLQPHVPFISWENRFEFGKGNFGLGGKHGRGAWAQLSDGDLSYEQLWLGYRENLELALSAIELLVENVDTNDVVLTSDHGNAAGEWGLYGHPIHMPFDCLRKVPWAEVSASYKGDREPNIKKSSQDIAVKDQLSALGYT